MDNPDFHSVPTILSDTHIIFRILFGHFHEIIVDFFPRNDI